MVRTAAALLIIVVTAALAALVPYLAVVLVLAGGFLAVLTAALGGPARQGPVRAAPLSAGASEESLVMAITEPLLIVIDGRVRVANAAARAMLGQHIIGEDVRLAIRHPAAAERLASEAGDGSAELPGLGGRDQRVHMHVATFAPGRRLIHLIDRTPNYAAERARVDFVANSSHELRTPLAAIIGFIETLDEENTGADPEVRARFLGVMMKEARRMQRLIDDLISLSRIEAEKHSLPETPVHLNALVEEVIDEFRDAGGGARPELMFDAPAQLPPVLGDRMQLSQVLHNLVGNALKYGGSGRPVTIRLSPDGKQHIRLSVSDQGEGIAPEHVPRLTERFYRVDPGRSRALGGTGLGLAIVKHIVERHRGQLDIKSTPGSGTTISVLLPTAAEGAVIETSPN
jgi:two-component system, OmpR family, phosphate regulon sensor histidine kinase PhoR